MSGAGIGQVLCRAARRGIVRPLGGVLNNDSLRCRGLSTAAGGGKKAKKGQDAGAGLPPVGDPKLVAPVNIFKDGTDPPILPDDEYPQWLFHIRPWTLPEMNKMDLAQLPLKEQTRYWKLMNREVIKEKNKEKEKL